MAEPTGTLQRTPLFDLHVEAGAKLVPFAGYEMPVQYSGVIDEHHAVRNAAGLFDVSHMGEFEAKGPESQAFLQKLLTNNVAKLDEGGVMYTAMCLKNGGIVDDLTVYRLGPDRYMAVVNAANISKDWEWMSSHLSGEVDFQDKSPETALLALQGPRSSEILSALIPGGGELNSISYYSAAAREVVGREAIVSRTGYTGEDGFELYCKAADSSHLWQEIMGAGASKGLKPCGLGARDTLRTEMKYALYGNDIDETTNPLEAGLGWVVKFKAGDFVGREALLKIREGGISRKLIGFEMIDRGIPRHGAPILVDGETAGVVTSGTMSPSLGKAIGIGYVPISHSEDGSGISVDIRGTPRAAKVVKTPFYRKEKKGMD